MKNLVALLYLCMACSAFGYQSFNTEVMVGATAKPASSSVLEARSTTKGFLPPRMTTAQKNAISSPTAGLQVYDTTLNQLQIYDGSSWAGVGGGGITPPASAASNSVFISADNTGQIAASSTMLINGNDASLPGELTLDNGNIDVAQEIKQSLSTGLVSSVSCSIDADPAKFDISGGVGHIVDFTDPLNPVYTEVTIPSSSANTVTNLASADITYVYFDTSGSIVQSTSSPTANTRRSDIYVCRLVHTNRTSITQALNNPDVAVQTGNQLNDFFRYNGIFNISGNVFSANGANLKLNKTAGSVFSVGSNFASDNENPHQVAIASTTALTFQYIDQDTGGTTNATDIVPGTYDNAGTPTAIGGSNNQATVQRIYLFPSGAVRVAYGQTVYSTHAAAVAAIATQSFVDNPNIAGNGFLRGLLVVTKGCTDLSSSCALFLQPSRYGETTAGAGAQAVSSLQDAYNNTTDGSILLDSTRGAVEIKDNGTPLNAALFEVTNSAGSSSYFKVASESIYSNVVTASQTVYNQIATPSNPTSGKNKLYFKNDDKLYKLTSGGTESEVGGTGDYTFVGSSYMAANASCTTGVASGGTPTAFGTTAACPAMTVEHSNLGTWSTADQNKFMQEITSLPEGTYRACMEFITSINGSEVMGVGINDGTTTCPMVGYGGYANGNQFGARRCCIFNYASSGTRTYQPYVQSGGSTITFQGGTYNSYFTLERIKP